MPSITWAYAVLSATGLLLLLWTFNCRIGLPTTIEQQDEVMAQQSALPVTDRALYDGSQLVMVAATNSGTVDILMDFDTPAPLICLLIVLLCIQSCIINPTSNLLACLHQTSTADAWCNIRM